MTQTTARLVYLRDARARSPGAHLNRALRIVSRSAPADDHGFAGLLAGAVRRRPVLTEMDDVLAVVQRVGVVHADLCDVIARPAVDAAMPVVGLDVIAAWAGVNDVGAVTRVDPVAAGAA